MKFVIKKTVNDGALWPSKEDGWMSMSPSDFFTIDPGSEGSGWALWERKKFKELCKPIASGSIAAITSDEDGNDFPWQQYVRELAKELVFGLRRKLKTEAVLWYVEEPTFMEGGKGMVTARSGALIKLVTLYGAIAGCTAPASFNFVPVPIAAWKGNMDKDLTKYRVMKRLEPLGWRPTTGTTHEIDAVGIGLYIKSHFG